MATFVKNIQKIRGEAIYGPEMREAIAEALQQTVDLDLDGNDGIVLFMLTPIGQNQEDFILNIMNGDQS